MRVYPICNMSCLASYIYLNRLTRLSTRNRLYVVLMYCAIIDINLEEEWKLITYRLTVH